MDLFRQSDFPRTKASSHDFVKFFGGTDKPTLAPGVGWVDFTQNANGVPAILDRVDVLVWSANQPVSSATCQALIDYAERNRGRLQQQWHGDDQQQRPGQCRH